MLMESLPKMKILSLFIHSHVVPNFDFKTMLVTKHFEFHCVTLYEPKTYISQNIFFWLKNVFGRTLWPQICWAWPCVDDCVFVCVVALCWWPWLLGLMEVEGSGSRGQRDTDCFSTHTHICWLHANTHSFSGPHCLLSHSLFLSHSCSLFRSLLKFVRLFV